MSRSKWLSAHENQARKCVDDMLVSMTRGSYEDTPELWQVRPFIIYTPKLRLFWFPDDEDADEDGMSLVSFRSQEGKPVRLMVGTGLYSVPHGEINARGKPNFTPEGSPKSFQELSDLILDILTDKKCELTPYECRRSCAKAEALEEMYDLPDSPDASGKVVAAQ